MGGPITLSLAAVVALLVWVMGLVGGLVALLGKRRRPKGDPARAGRSISRVFLWGIWILGLVGLVIAFMPATSSVREVPRRVSCLNNLKQIGLAMHNYHDRYRCFPPAYTADRQGRRLQSWRVLLLPFLEHEALYDQLRLSEPWDGPQNRAVLADCDTPAVYRCPSAVDDQQSTNYVVIVGPETVFDGAGPRRIEDIVDGTSQTIMALETVGSGIHWAEPRDLDFAALNFESDDPADHGLRSEHPQAVNALFGDGTVHPISDDIDPKILRALITVAGGEDVSAFWEGD